MRDLSYSGIMMDMGFNFCEGFALKNDVQTPTIFIKTTCNPLKFHKPFLKLPIFWLGIFEINSEIVSSRMIGNNGNFLENGT
jgi:hypothetical protein